MISSQRDEQRLFGKGALLGDDVVDEGLHLGLGGRSNFDVDVQRTGQRSVGAVLNGLGGRLDTALAAVNRQRLEIIGVLLEVRETEVAKAAGVALDAGDGVVVVLRRAVLVL